jgi:putative ABC transport system permease protein
MALGARSADVIRLVLRETAVILATGLAAGVGLAVPVGKGAASVLYGVRAVDPVSMGAAIVLLALTAILASYLPARRASRLDPTRALRCD